MGTTQGGTNAHKTLKKKLGRAGYAQHMASIGARGGKVKVPKGFSVTRKKAPDAQELHEGVQPGRGNERDSRD